MAGVFSRVSRRCIMALGLACGALAALPALAQTADQQTTDQQTTDQQTGKVDWGIWIDGDGCMHWWADGGFEGYMVPRRNPKTGRPVCLKRHACLVENSDGLFADEATLTKAGKARLVTFFEDEGAQAYAIFAHGDGAGGKARSERLTKDQAAAVAAVAKTAGARVTEARGGGARYPKVSNASDAGKATNRRVEVVCYR